MVQFCLRETIFIAELVPRETVKETGGLILSTATSAPDSNILLRGKPQGLSPVYRELVGVVLDELYSASQRQPNAFSVVQRFQNIVNLVMQSIA